eukprot:CAMPEP_0117503248 /NCGR_PEP_ID=MMETSP0784-20121206/24230_1 /TAXON_ID=39447 /ORGANISM="" /LENGTH=294 /DNA_ID=CAMNT_0005298555 /DNA_START=68 /DNA_END=952 /DNA_ORIENTATION=-
MIYDMDAILAKEGQELFKELLRFYEAADLEDYYKLALGQWRDDQMRTDIQLFVQHRREAGAPEAPAVEDVEMPEIPAPTASAGVGGAVKMGTSGLVVQAPGATGTNLINDLKEIAGLVAKFKLEPLKAKTLLSKLPSNRKKYVTQHFATTTTGADATAALEKYIAQCEKENLWPAAVSAPAITAPAGAAVASTAKPAIVLGAPRPAIAAKPSFVLGAQGAAVKRPLTITIPAAPAAKQARVGTPVVAARPTITIGAQRPAGAPIVVRPALQVGAPAVRPGTPRPRGPIRVVVPK